MEYQIEIRDIEPIRVRTVLLLLCVEPGNKNGRNGLVRTHGRNTHQKWN